MTQQPLLEIKDLHCLFPGRRKMPWQKAPGVKAVDGVSFAIMPGESFGLVGESGCGKSTLGNMAAAILSPTAGRVFFQGEEITPKTAGKNGVRDKLQVVFQDPAGTLNPRLVILDQVMEPLRIQKKTADAAIRDMALASMAQVGLSAEHGARYPHELSGGQRQRAVVARALVTQPRLVICDEPTSALDVSIQAQVINLLADLKTRNGMSYLFISHNLGVVRSICERVAVMYLGRIVELAPRESLFNSPMHPYTQALLAANPVPDPTRPRTPVTVKGDPPSPMHIPSGCRFHTRCERATPPCAERDPVLREVAPGHFLACCGSLAA